MTAQPERLQVSVLGAGSWGTALAALASSQADTLLWARDAATARAIDQDHRNPRYLSDIALPRALHATDDFAGAIRHACDGPSGAGLLILAVPVAGLSATCADIARILPPDQCDGLGIVWTCKGFHLETGQLPHDIAQAAFTGQPGVRLGVLSGPSFAREVAQGLPVALTIAASANDLVQKVTAVMHGSNARIYGSHDIIGVEVGGALKNVMAIACGISDGLGLGTNARAALITRGLAEMQRLGVTLGGEPDTFSGLTGLGDLVLTATGELSRNRQVGLAIAEGRSLADILATGMTAEGVRCARAALELGRRHQVDLPVTDAVCRVLFQGLAPQQAVSELLGREARSELSSAPR